MKVAEKPKCLLAANETIEGIESGDIPSIDKNVDLSWILLQFKHHDELAPRHLNHILARAHVPIHGYRVNMKRVCEALEDLYQVKRELEDSLIHA